MSDFEIISSDGIGVRALLAASEKVRELLDERNIILGVLKGDALGQDEDVAVVVAKGYAGTPGAVLVTVEQNPRLVRAKTLAAETPKRGHLTNEGPHLGPQGDCWCTADCCNDADDECSCTECNSEHHGH